MRRATCDVSATHVARRTSHVVCCRHGSCGAAGGCRRRLVLRPPARAVDALLHRDVGALQLLRHARISDPVYDGAGGRRRIGICRCARGVDLRDLHRQRVGRRHSRRRGRGSFSRPVPQRAHRRHHHRRRAFHAGLQSASILLHRPGTHRHRHRPAETERQHDGRIPLPGRRRAAGRGVLHFLHGDQPRGIHRAAHRRLARATRGLASGVRRGWHRDGLRTDPVRARKAATPTGAGTTVAKTADRVGSTHGCASRRQRFRTPGIHRRRVETHRRDRGVLPRGGHFLGRVRAGRAPR